MFHSHWKLKRRSKEKRVFLGTGGWERRKSLGTILPICHQSRGWRTLVFGLSESVSRFTSQHHLYF